MVARPPAAARADRRRGGHGARGRPVRARPPGAGGAGHLRRGGAPRPLPGGGRDGAAAAGRGPRRRRRAADRPAGHRAGQRDQHYRGRERRRAGHLAARQRADRGPAPAAAAGLRRRGAAGQRGPAGGRGPAARRPQRGRAARHPVHPGRGPGRDAGPADPGLGPADRAGPARGEGRRQPAGPGVLPAGRAHPGAVRGRPGGRRGGDPRAAEPAGRGTAAARPGPPAAGPGTALAQCALRGPDRRADRHHCRSGRRRLRGLVQGRHRALWRPGRPAHRQPARSSPAPAIGLFPRAHRAHRAHRARGSRWPESRGASAARLRARGRHCGHGQLRGVSLAPMLGRTAAR